MTPFPSAAAKEDMTKFQAKGQKSWLLGSGNWGEDKKRTWISKNLEASSKQSLNTSVVTLENLKMKQKLWPKSSSNECAMAGV
jgi:hypothetical protein